MKKAELLRDTGVFYHYLCSCGDTFTRRASKRDEPDPVGCCECTTKARGKYSISGKSVEIDSRPNTYIEQDMIDKFLGKG